jgi:hypothetical protein
MWVAALTTNKDKAISLCLCGIVKHENHLVLVMICSFAMNVGTVYATSHFGKIILLAPIQGSSLLSSPPLDCQFCFCCTIGNRTWHTSTVMIELESLSMPDRRQEHMRQIPSSCWKVPSSCATVVSSSCWPSQMYGFVMLLHHKDVIPHCCSQSQVLHQPRTWCEMLLDVSISQWNACLQSSPTSILLPKNGN